MTWSEYVKECLDGKTQKAIEKRSGVKQPVISDWKRGQRPGNAAYVAAFAQACGRNPIDAFVAAGFLTREQAGAPRDVDLTEVGNLDLAHEVTRRLTLGRVGARDTPERVSLSKAARKRQPRKPRGGSEKRSG